MRALAAPVLKALAAGAMLVWMARSGKLDFAQIVSALAYWPLLLTILALGYCQVAMMAWRLRVLLRAQGIPVSFRLAWGLTMIGLLFNFAIPGVTGGDLIKGYYLTRGQAGRRAYAAMAVVVDRVAGLIGLLFLGAAVIVANPGQTFHHPATRTLGALTITAFIGGLISLYAGLYAGGKLAASSSLPRFARSLFAALHEFSRQPLAMAAVLGISVANQLITCASFYFALCSAGVTIMPPEQFFLVVPLGLVAGAIPIAPAGIGVGQGAFYALFQIVAPPYALAGTVAVTVSQMVSGLLSLTGLLWYVPNRTGNPATQSGAGR